MSMLTSSSGASAVLPAEYGEIVTKPVEALSVAYLTGTKVLTSSNSYEIPILASDVTAGAIAEGAEITPSDAAFNPLRVVPAKFGGLTIISRELADDSNPSAADQVGRSIARQIANSVDNSLFNALSAPNPAGFASLSGISTVRRSGNLRQPRPIRRGRFEVGGCRGSDYALGYWCRHCP